MCATVAMESEDPRHPFPGEDRQILRMVAVPGREFGAPLEFSAVSSGVVAVQGMWLGLGTIHLYALIGMWLGRVTPFEYSSALGVVSSVQKAVPFVFIFSSHVDGI